MTRKANPKKASTWGGNYSYSTPVECPCEYFVNAPDHRQIPQDGCCWQKCAVRQLDLTEARFQPQGGAEAGHGRPSLCHRVQVNGPNAAEGYPLETAQEPRAMDLLVDTQAIRLIPPGSSGSHAIRCRGITRLAAARRLRCSSRQECQPRSTQLEDHGGSDPEWRDCIVARRESSIAPGSFLLDSA